MNMSNISLSSTGANHSRSHSVAPSVASNAGITPSGGGVSSPKKRESSHTRHHSIQKPVVIIPTVSEHSFGGSIGARTANLPNFKELGPPDLVHISKYNKQSQKEEGQYHYITGLDVSSAVAPVAYLTTLNLNSTSSSSKHPSIYTYCAYNAFSRSDIRIRTEFPNATPGSFQLQLIPSDRGNKTLNEVSEDIWDELFVSAVVRSVIINLDFERKVPSLIEKPLTKSIQHSKNIITRLIKFIERGPVLGCSSLIQRPSISQNYLIDALLKIVELTSLYEFTIDQLNTLAKKKDATLLIVKVLFLADREVDAIKLLYEALKKNSRDTLLLNEQVKFLISKEKFELALNPALAAVNGNPVDFEAWYNLTKLQILNNNLPLALVALNSAPMYGIRPKDLIYIDPKDTVTVPYPTEGKIKQVWDNISQVFGPGSDNSIKFSPRFEVEACDPALIRTNSQQMKGTYKSAYDLLILIINQVGWDQLLRSRSKVFIMDDEYKTLSNVTLPIHKDASDDIKKKRLCERWLDNLFLVLYEDLRVVLIVENELQNEKQLKHSGLEWQLIGLASYRTNHFKNAVAALRTTLSAKFDIIAAYKLLELWEENYTNKEFKIWNDTNKYGDFEITLDQILDVLVRSISYNIRFFNEFELQILLFLKKFLIKFDVDYIKNKIQVLFENDNKDYKNSGVIPPFDSLVSDIQIFSPDYHRI